MYLVAYEDLEGRMSNRLCGEGEDGRKAANEAAAVLGGYVWEMDDELFAEVFTDFDEHIDEHIAKGDVKVEWRDQTYETERKGRAAGTGR